MCRPSAAWLGTLQITCHSMNRSSGISALRIRVALALEGAGHRVTQHFDPRWIRVCKQPCSLNFSTKARSACLSNHDTLT